MANEAAESDVWSQWLLQSRHGGDAAYGAFVRRDVERYRRRVLAGARLGPGMRVVDVGAGEGLIAFGAIAEVGPSLRVVLTDVSAPMLAHARQLAAELGVAGQCEFLLGNAERLDGLAGGSVDVVATRSSLAYVADKVAAMREFHRVLKPGGRISLGEPILQDEAFETCALGRLIVAQPAHPDIEMLRLRFRWKAAQNPSNEEAMWKNPLTNYSERDLVRFAQLAGFLEIHMELHIDHRLVHGEEGVPGLSWEVFLSLAPHPLAPPLGRILAERFSAEERARFEREMRPRLESPTWVYSGVMAYLTATKPA